MKALISFVVCCSFLLQTFVTVQAMPIHEGKVEMPCMTKQQVSKKHTCCTLLNKEKQTSDKKGCCTGTSKMSCCIYLIALTPNLPTITFISPIYQKDAFGYLESHSSFEVDIFHPPTLV